MPKTYNDKKETARWNKANSNINKVNANDILKRQFDTVNKNITAIYTRNVIASIALCNYYSARALEVFRRFQSFNVFWNNRTNSAYNQVFASNIVGDTEIEAPIPNKLADEISENANPNSEILETAKSK